MTAAELGPEELVASKVGQWNDCAGLKEASLLRLAMLRELVRELHASRSHCLSTGMRSEVTSIRDWESRVEELRAVSPLDGDLLELLRDPARAARKRTRLLPEALLSRLGREKLERYDRVWEAALAAEACSLGWPFWSLEAWVEVSSIEPWNRRLHDCLWPHGVSLFVETLDSSDGAWKGRWVIVLHSRFRAPAELSHDVASWPGSPARPPTPATWKLLFTPKGL